jgi:hypothetical protein
VRGRECFTLGNFKKDATVRPSHGRPRGHCPTVRSSVIVHVTTLSGGAKDIFEDEDVMLYLKVGKTKANWSSKERDRVQ